MFGLIKWRGRPFPHVRGTIRAKFKNSNNNKVIRRVVLLFFLNVCVPSFGVVALLLLLPLLSIEIGRKWLFVTLSLNMF